MRRLGDSGTLGTGETTLASAATTDLGAAKTRDVLITGTTTITSFGTAPNRDYRLRFSGALTLTHNATSLILPGAANITTIAGDVAVIESDTSGNWRVTGFQSAIPSAGGATGGVRTISTADTIIASDKGKVLQVSGTFTLGATAAATLGASFFCYIRKTDATGKVTLDPNGSETVDGRTTIAVYGNESFLLYCNGTGFYTVNRDRRVLITTQTIASAVASVDFTALNDTEIVAYELLFRGVIGSTDHNLQFVTSHGGVFQSAYPEAGYLSNINGLAGLLSITSPYSVTAAPVNNFERVGRVRTSFVQTAAIGFPFIESVVTIIDTSNSRPTTYSAAGRQNGSASLFDGLRLFASTGNLAAGTILLYGER